MSQAPNRLYYNGHGSFRLHTSDGTVIYVDPFAGDGYDEPADFAISTHGHSDHCSFHLITNRKDGFQIFTHEDALKNGQYQEFDMGMAHVKSVTAYNKNHARESCVGYLITVDDVTVYFAGDMSYMPELEDLKKENITYALWPCDGFYNMGVEEAAKCARTAEPKYNVPVHTCPKEEGFYKESVALSFPAELNRVLVKPGEYLELFPSR